MLNKLDVTYIIENGMVYVYDKEGNLLYTA